eukprot:scaffold69780_cov47-Phaeocystis_antarctica.AAC.1
MTCLQIGWSPAHLVCVVRVYPSPTPSPTPTPSPSPNPNPNPTPNQAGAVAEAGYLLFARVNTLLGASVDTAAAELRAQGWEELPPLGGDAAASPLAAA